MERAMQANRLQLAGFRDAAAVIVKGLKRETEGQNYGSFRLGEGDEASLDAVESPQIH